MKKANMGFFIINCMHWQFQEALVFRVQLSPLFESRCSWNLLREATKPLAGSNLYLLFWRRKKKQISMQNVPNTEPNRTEIDQEPHEPKPNMNRTGPIANTRNRNRTEPKPHCNWGFCGATTDGWWLPIPMVGWYLVPWSKTVTMDTVEY